ncbi:MAG: cytochrome c3 family protein [Desulforhopalus sp.]
MNKIISFAVTTALVILCWESVEGAADAAERSSILDSKHNLSTSGPGELKATRETRVCIFCHTPHNSRRDVPFLWNRSDRTTNYLPYRSSTMHASVGQPTGASKLCLSCHDGTIAMGAVLSEPEEIEFLGGIRSLPSTRSSYLGTDLSDDHPISFYYGSSTDQGNPELVISSILPEEIRLADDGQLQCTTCHDPHDDSWGSFLVMSNQYSRLCTGCHDKRGWVDTSHALSSAGWNGRGGDPWPNSEYNTVAENGCTNCHQPHSAGNHQRLLKREFEEDNCIVCHNGNVAGLSIESELTKPYLHPVHRYKGVHDPAENFTFGGVDNHVECVDCHNPHQVGNSFAAAPSVSGKNTGVAGIDLGGQQLTQAENLYEICFKCHGDNNVTNASAVTRQINQLNTRFEFSPGNPSFHPVVTATNGSYVPSLRSPYSAGSIIYCTDCHGSGNPAGPQGPHGSFNEHLLVERYEMSDMTSESGDAYALCYKCHDRSVILSGTSGFPLHRKHVQLENTPCAVCHDPHGISATQGNPTNNSRLINFDLTVVLPNSSGELYFEAEGRGQRTCALLCHGNDHRLPGP